MWILSPLAHLRAWVTLLTVVTVCSASFSLCPESQFFNLRSHTCEVCSTCPKNQIIRKPCSRHGNTLCGPFVEFNQFHQAPRPTSHLGELPVPQEGGGSEGAGQEESDDNHSELIKHLAADMEQQEQQQHKHHFHYKQRQGEKQRKGSLKEFHFPQEGAIESFPGAREPLLGKTPHVKTAHVNLFPTSKARGQMASQHESDEAEKRWKVLALSLIVVLCVVCVFLIVFVFVVCYMRSGQAHMKKVLNSTGPSHTTRSQGRSLNYEPVFTNAHSRTGSCREPTNAPPCRMADSSYLDEYDADNSGQTVSTTKSSDYVYFKSPHNGGNIHDV